MVDRPAADSDPAWPLVPRFAPDLFRGTAEYYARYRPPYPQELLDRLRHDAGVSGDGRLVDLACGTGELAVTLHPHFRDVWAVDQEQEMLDVGQAKAKRSGAKNIRWTHGRAEDLDAEPGSAELITIGNAFHRLDRPLIAQHAQRWLPPGHCLAIVSSTSLWSGTADWQAIARDAINKYRTRPQARAGHQAPDQPMRTHQAVLAEAGFEIHERDFPTSHTWTLDDFVGYLSSTASATKILRETDDSATFETNLRERLLDYDPSGQYEETIEFSCILATKPQDP